ncbi:MAG: isocitrate dehydrogenase [Lewinellaceae bacterium]|nr:NADP-dependent isocitrate dehydrogenase [Saprospiraceae bacterium]MCB9338390.1 isocitrate dehydrogenase [Lewinellaceae bacterium]
MGKESNETKLESTQAKPAHHAIAVAKGDGIGPEIMDAVLSIFRATNVPLDFEYVDMGKSIYDQGYSAGMTTDAKEKIEQYGILFKGPMETPKGKGVKSVNVTARKVWNTFANKRVFKSLHGVDTVFSRAGIPVDITIVRENIEDTYGAIEHMITHDVALCRRFATRPGALQVHRYAFELARKKGARKVTCGHKANIMKLTDGLFLEVFYEVAKDYPDLVANDVIVDDLAMKLVSRPHEFDIVVLPNLQGDIISDLCAGLVGGLGFAPSANIGDNISIFEAVHGTAPDIAGQNKANPTALLLSGIMMLRHLGLTGSAAKIENALLYTLEQGVRTADFGDKNMPALGTTDFAQAIIGNLGQMPSYSKSSYAAHPDAFEHNPPKKLSQNIMRVTPKPSERIIGVDFFVESEDQPDVCASKFQAVLDARYELTMISNRGTQVWPTGSIYTECINQHRVRVEVANEGEMSQQAVLELGARVAGAFKICTIEYLMEYGGKKSFSLAQGQ